MPDTVDAAPRSPGRRLFAGLVLSFSGMWLALLGVLTAFCVYVWTPHLLVLCALGLVAGVAAPVAAWTRKPTRQRWALGELTVCLVAAGWFAAPSAAPQSPEGLVRSCTLPGYSERQPWFGGIPERELVLFGAWVMSTEHERASAVRPGLFERHYDRIAQEGSVASEPSWVLDAWLFDRGHYWLALPKGPGPHPLLVFLHGNAGPFQFYPETLAQPLVDQGFAVVLPSFGFGYWDRPEGYARVEAVIQAVCAEQPIDAERVFLGGLSAGAIGALSVFARDPQAYRGCLSVSGDAARGLSPVPFVGRPLLLLHGSHDQRLPIAGVRSFVEELRAAGGEPDYVEVEDADHYLLMTHEETTLAKVCAWLARER